MNAFIAWTPLHIINIINTAEAYYHGEDNDLFIYDEFEGAKSIYHQLQTLGYFRNVYYICHKENGNKLNMAFSMLINRQHFIKHNSIYRNIFIQGGNYFSKLLYGEIKKLNPNLQLHYIEDGLGAYVDSPIIRLDTPAKKFIKYFNKYSMYHASIDTYYVYEPDLIIQKKEVNCKKLPKLTADNTAREKIRRAFSMKSNNPSASLVDKIVFFDQPLLDDGFEINEIELVNLLKKLKTKRDLLVKLHPRTQRNKYGDIDVIKTDLPWELYFLNMDMDNVVLLSIATTAAFTPYLMYGIDIPVIILAPYYLNSLKDKDSNSSTIKLLESVVEFSSLFKEKTGVSICTSSSYEVLKKL